MVHVFELSLECRQFQSVLCGQGDEISIVPLLKSAERSHRHTLERYVVGLKFVFRESEDGLEATHRFTRAHARQLSRASGIGPGASKEAQEGALALRRGSEAPQAFDEPAGAAVIRMAFIERSDERVCIQQHLIHRPALLRLLPLRKPRRASGKPVQADLWLALAEDLAAQARKRLCPGKCSRGRPWLWRLEKHPDPT